MAETLIALTAALGSAAGSVGATSAAGALAGASSALSAGTGLAALVPSASTLATIGSGLTAAGTVYGGVQAANAAEFEAKQMKAKGDEEFAISQQKAAQAKREKDLALSRVRAVAGASGGRVDDPSITAIMEGIQEQGDYNSMVQLYQGKSNRNKLYGSAAARKAEGRSALTASLLKGAGSLYSS